MRRLSFASAALVLALGLSACASGNRLGGAGPDEFATARRAPLVVPPDFALTPPTPGAPRPQEADSSTEALEAMFGGPAPRSATESALLAEAGAATVDPGIRSAVGAPATNVADKGATTSAIIAAPEGDGQDARASVPQ